MTPPRTLEADCDLVEVLHEVVDDLDAMARRLDAQIAEVEAAWDNEVDDDAGE